MMIYLIGEITKTSEKATEIIENMKKEIENWKIGETITEKKRVYFEISPAPDLLPWKRFIFTRNIEIVGTDNVFADKGKGIAISSEQYWSKPGSYPHKWIIDNPIGKSRDGWNSITAVATDQVHYIDANSSSRPSKI